jgi:hypothetical protein
MDRVLVIGLDPHHVPGPWDPEPVARAIAAGMAALRDAGLDAVSCLVALDGSADPLATVAAALADGSWDCVLIGGGIRSDPELLELFEAVVNLARTRAPIAFNTRPDDLLGPIRRALR